MKIAVLISGSGTNLQALIDAAAADPGFGAEIVLVLSDRPRVKGLKRAEAAGIPTAVVAWRDHTHRDSFTAAVCDAVDASGAEVMVLAGFMRILGPGAVQRFPHRMINVHPALLPAFPGAHAVPQALAHGVKLTGVTVHFVDEEVDHGPIILQEAVPVEQGDTEDALHARIQKVEHRVLPLVVKALAGGKLAVRGREVIWSG